MVMVFHTTFHNISAVSWRPVLQVEYPEKITCSKSLTNFITLKKEWLSNISTLSVPDYGYSRNTWCALNLISTCSLLYLVHLAMSVLQLHLSLSITKKAFQTFNIEESLETPKHGFREKRSMG